MGRPRSILGGERETQCRWLNARFALGGIVRKSSSLQAISSRPLAPILRGNPQNLLSSAAELSQAERLRPSLQTAALPTAAQPAYSQPAAGGGT